MGLWGVLLISILFSSTKFSKFLLDDAVLVLIFAERFKYGETYSNPDFDKVLQYLSKEFAVPAERLGDKAMFVGRRDPDDFTRLFQIYVKDFTYLLLVTVIQFIL